MPPDSNGDQGFPGRNRPAPLWLPPRSPERHPADETSIITVQSRAPREAKCAGISIFALSTYDTDYVMVKQADFERATQALRTAGYSVSGP